MAHALGFFNAFQVFVIAIFHICFFVQHDRSYGSARHALSGTGCLYRSGGHLRL
jgi:hypothetical protein